MGVANAGQQPFAEIFPGIANPQGTGAPGSQTVASTPESGTPLGPPVVVSVPGWSSQPSQPTLQVGTDDTLTPAAAGEYGKTEKLSGVTLVSGGMGSDGVPFGQGPLDRNQVTDHPNSHGRA